MIMVHNYEVVFCEDNELNPITSLWHKFFISTILNDKFFELIRLVNMHWRWMNFNNICFMKNKLWNYFRMHLDLCTEFYN